MKLVRRHKSKRRNQTCPGSHGNATPLTALLSEGSRKQRALQSLAGGHSDGHRGQEYRTGFRVPEETSWVKFCYKDALIIKYSFKPFSKPPCLTFSQTSMKLY